MSNSFQIRTDFQIGERAQLSKVIREDDIEKIAEVTKDYNPLHFEEDFAKQTRFGGCIAHGLLGLGLISAVLGTKLPGPGAIYLSQKIDFISPVRVGDKITAVAEVRDWQPEKRIVTLHTQCLKEDQKTVIEGRAKLLIESID